MLVTIALASSRMAGIAMMLYSVPFTYGIIYNTRRADLSKQAAIRMANQMTTNLFTRVHVKACVTCK